MGRTRRRGYSPDGRHIWDGERWIPLDGPRRHRSGSGHRRRSGGSAPAPGPGRAPAPAPAPAAPPPGPAPGPAADAAATEGPRRVRRRVRRRRRALPAAALAALLVATTFGWTATHEVERTTRYSGLQEPTACGNAGLGDLCGLLGRLSMSTLDAWQEANR